MMPLSLRFAWREMRGGVRGFRIFLACLALGAAAIAAAGSTAAAFRAGLAAQAREIVGGDLAVALEEREFTSPERRALERLGRVAYAAASRAMAEAPNGERRLAEVRGVGPDYPLAGAVELGGEARLADALAPAGGAAGVAVEQSLLDRLGLRLGDRFELGDIPVVARAVLISEPDRLGRGFPLGPRVLARLDVIRAGGLLAPGLPFGETARVVLRPGLSIRAARSETARLLPGGAYRVRDRNNAAPGIGRLIDQLEYFLGFVGLASLIAGGLGVSGAVGAYLDERTDAIATLKVLGADGALVRNAFLAQIAALACLGVAIGVAAGAAVPPLVGALVRRELPVPALFGLYPAPLVRAAGFGLLAAAAFSLAPLGRARRTPPAALFRRETSAAPGFGVELAGAVMAGAALAVIAVATAPTPTTAAAMIAAVSVAFAALALVGVAIVRAASRLRGLARGGARLGLANLAGPRSAARTAAPAIGLGVGLMAVVVLVQSSLVAEVAVTAPRQAPALVFTEIPPEDDARFDAAVARAFGRPLAPSNFQRFAYASGRIVGVRGRPVQRGRIAPQGRWAFDADLVIAAIGTEPPAAGVVAGRWWPAGYRGPPLVALDADVAHAAGLKVGDEIAISALGRTLAARISALRHVELSAFGPDFTLVVDEAAFTGANLRELAIARATPAEEARVTRALGADFAAVQVISVREALEAALGLLKRVTLAVRGAAAVAALAGLLVLAGAIAAGARARVREAAILKVIGASRRQVLGTYLVEYGAVGAAAGLAGVALGAMAAWPVVTLVFEAPWSIDWAGALGLVAGAAGIASAGGLLAALHALAHPPAPALREP